MNATSPRYDRWKAPAEDGQLLIWPKPAEIRRDTLENQRLLSEAHSVRLQNIPLPEVRSAFRKKLARPEELPIIATGHQTELHHPGVWIKNVLIDAVADDFGTAIHFAVDTDEPKHLTLRWPGGAIPLVEDTSGARWSGLLKPPSTASLNRIEQVVAEAQQHWNFQPLLGEFLKLFRKNAAESRDLPSALYPALLYLDCGPGLQIQGEMASLVCDWDPYLLFAHHILSNAVVFAADYNAALAEYRRENRIRSPGRPMPDLAVSQDSIEAPFWLDDLSTGQRARAQVSRDTGGFVLHAAGDAFVFKTNRDGWVAAKDLKRWLHSHNLQLSPRALTLTAVLRLLGSDQFVHGIGGGQYDQVLDKLISRHLGLTPPRFAVATATLYFPDATAKPRVCLPCLRQEGHRLRHGVLGPMKKELVAAIAAAPRRSGQRATLFAQMHQQMRAPNHHSELERWEQKYAQALAQAQEERAWFDRELFYAIQPRERLNTLIETVRDLMASA